MRKASDDIRAVQKQGEHAQVLSNGPIPEVKLGPVATAPGDEASPIERRLFDPSTVAPVVADATMRLPIGRKGDEPEAPEAKYYVVLETKYVIDDTSGARTQLRAGKVISDAHYKIRKLQTQGVKLKRTEAPSADNDEPIEELLS